MIELVNLSNYGRANNSILNNCDELAKFLNKNNLAGVEMMFCQKWNKCLQPEKFIKGVHLRFWPNWLDFWLENENYLKTEFPTKKMLAKYYGGINKEEWLNVYKENILLALSTKPEYLVLHVSQARTSEIFSYNFYYKSKFVVANAVQLINRLVENIPADTLLLLENLWWPGLTFCEPELVRMLIEKINHPNVGFMLDTGHLMNTNHNLKSEQEGIDYILQIVSNLGIYKKYIRGIHLHHSLSGEYTQNIIAQNGQSDLSIQKIMEHVLKIDQHVPFSIPEVQNIIKEIQPDYLVHEFMISSIIDWQEKLKIQRHALGRII